MSWLRISAVTVQEKVISTMCAAVDSQLPFHFYVVSSLSEKILKQNFALGKAKIPDGQVVLVDPGVAGLRGCFWLSADSPPTRCDLLLRIT